MFDLRRIRTKSRQHSERAYRMQLQRWGYMKYNTRKSHGRRREPATNITLQSQLVPESISSETHLVR